MSLEASSSATALRLITKYGRNVVVNRVSVPGTYDTTTGKTSAPTIVTATIKAYVADFTNRTPFQYQNVQVKTGDKLILIAGSGFTKPDIGDTFVVDGKTYTIVPRDRNGLGVETIYVADTAVMHKIHGRIS